MTHIPYTHPPTSALSQPYAAFMCSLYAPKNSFKIIRLGTIVLRFTGTGIWMAFGNSL